MGSGGKARVFLCVRCGCPLAERRPVFLCATGTGRIVGPYHAGCAEREVLAGPKADGQAESGGEVFGRVLPKDDDSEVIQ